MKRLKLGLIGFLTGGFSSGLGVGGGAIVIPALLYLCRYDMKRAIGTSLIVLVPAVTVGMLTHLCLAALHLKLFVAAIVLLGAVFGTLLGSHLAQKLSNRMLTLLFALILITVGLKMTGTLNFAANFIRRMALRYPSGCAHPKLRCMFSLTSRPF